MLFFFLVPFLIIILYVIYVNWPTENNTNRIQKFILRVRLFSLLTIVIVTIMVMLIEYSIGEYVIFKAKNLGNNLVVLTLYTYALNLCLLLYTLWIIYHIYIFFSFWKPFIWASIQEIYLELMLLLGWLLLIFFLVFLQYKTSFISGIEFFLILNQKENIDLTSFLLTALNDKNFNPSSSSGIKQLILHDQKDLGLVFVVDDTSSSSPKTNTRVIGELISNPETGGQAVCSRTVDLMEQNQDIVKDAIKTDPDQYHPILQPVARAYNKSIDVGYAIHLGVRDQNAITCIGDGSVNRDNLPEDSRLHPKPCESLYRRISEQLAKIDKKK